MGSWRPCSWFAKPLANLKGFGGLGFEEFMKKVAVQPGASGLFCLIHGARKKRFLGSLGTTEGSSVGTDESVDGMAW